MDRFAATFICAFIPHKKARRSVRGFFGRKKISPLRPLARFFLPKILPRQLHNAIIFEFTGGLADQLKMLCYVRTIYENWQGEKPQIIIDLGNIYKKPDKFVLMPQTLDEPQLRDLLKSKKRSYDSSGKKLLAKTFELGSYKMDWSWISGFVVLPKKWKNYFDLFGRRYIIFNTQKHNPFAKKKKPSLPLHIRSFPEFNLFESPVAAEFLKSIKAEVNGKNAEKLAEIKAAKNSICVHIRRGDYIAYNSGKTLPAAYFKKAVEKIITQNNWKEASLFVFSDDWNWAQSAINFNFDGVEIKTDFVRINDISQPIPELELMRSCKHFVISAGAFARIAAQMCDNPDKIVVMPSKDDFVRE
jgi:hypothetical protein